MRKLVAFVVGTLVVATAAWACSSSSSSGTGTGTTTGGKDAGSAADGTVCGDAGYSCGQPCDPGNSIGVGQFCNSVEDCLGTPQAHLCATLGDPTEHFCTFTCEADAGEAGASQCGDKATCQCQGTQCGCFPDYCK